MLYSTGISMLYVTVYNAGVRMSWGCRWAVGGLSQYGG